MTVSRWVLRFNEGTEDLKDFDRPGRPITAVTPVHIDNVRILIDENIHISYNQIVAETSLGRSCIQEIIHIHLKLNKNYFMLGALSFDGCSETKTCQISRRIFPNSIPDSGALSQ